MAQRAGNDPVTTARAALRMDQAPTRSVAPRTARLLDLPATPRYAATTTRDPADANASESTRPS